MANFNDFEKLDIRTGRIISVQDFPEARKPSYKLEIDFGQEIGTKKSCAQLTENYTKESLKGRMVLGIVNFPPLQVGPAISEVLTLGVPDDEGNCILVTPTDKVSPGVKLY
jgi:tRNA-binding protein